MTRRKRARPPDRVDRFREAVEELTAERALRSYGPQFVTVHSVARHIGITDEQAEAVVAEALERSRIIGDGSNPPHSIAVFHGSRE